ncbi:MAG: type II toxin-antitoxin system HicA family toxin [Candidatus Symbiothrix sp.]|jgi:predicted transcriptional regulator|nr:type II toxin-antitoxin system HicA family toxin [Candidatus Symbiothrix sp.]
MSTKDKLIKRFCELPKDFTFDELAKLLNGLGYEISNKGKTSGSRVRFSNAELKLIIDIHKPHTSGSPIKETALKDVYNKLVTNGLIK